MLICCFTDRDTSNSVVHACSRCAKLLAKREYAQCVLVQFLIEGAIAKVNQLRIFNGCEWRIEIPSRELIVQHLKACPVMPNSYIQSDVINEPCHKIMVLFVLHYRILQMGMSSHPVGLDV